MVRSGFGGLRTLLQKNVLLKRRNIWTTLLEFFFPLFFVGMLAGLKQATDIVRIPDGWATQNTNSCRYEVAPDGFDKTCNYPYARFTHRPVSYAQIQASVDGRWIGHETAKLFLATTSGSQREFDALMDFVEWMQTVGTAEGPVPEFDQHVFVLGNGTNEELNAYVASEKYGNPFTTETPECAGAIVFDKMDFLNAQFEYTIRLNSSSSADRFEVPRTVIGATDTVQRDLFWTKNSYNREYLRSGFSTFQIMIDDYIISRSGGANYTAVVDGGAVGNYSQDLAEYEPYGPKFVAFPVQEYYWDEFFFYVAELFPLVFALCYLYPVAKLMEGLVRERETRTTEMLKMMGLGEHWIIASWYVTYAIFYFILALIITGLCTLLLPSTSNTDGGSAFVFFSFFFYGIAVIAFCFTLSTLFWKARTAFFVGVVLYLIGFFFYYSINNPEVYPKPGLILLFPQVTFALMMQTVAYMEAAGVGAGPATLTEVVRGFDLATGFSMIIFDIFFWTAIGFYLSAIMPREYGQRLPFYFFLKPSYWRRKWQTWRRSSCFGGDSASTTRTGTELTAMDGSETASKLFRKSQSFRIQEQESVEPVEASLRQQINAGRGIQIREMKKVFNTPSGKKFAVQDFSLDIFEGQILALLGHNGAGKTTLLSILGGMYEATDGEALILGQNIKENMNEIRSHLGFCFQHDVLYDELTVAEHLRFVARIKGVPKNEVEKAVTESIAQVGLTEKRNANSKSLSGGMKRKLSLAMALIGGSKVVFVDEPTSGVDPYSRRSIWHLLQSNREGRVIVLTTHFMDEADFLGDRICIMAEGRLKCCGSSLYLKDKYGSGYLLTLEKNKTCNPKAVVKRIKKYIPQAALISNVGSEMSFQLPKASSGKFADCFRDLDASMKDLGIEEFGVSVTTLEEVFLKVARADDQNVEFDKDFNEEQQRPKSSKSVGAVSIKTDDIDVEDENFDLENGTNPFHAEKVTGFKLFWIQFTALFRKRVQFAKRDGRSFILSIVMPVVLYTVGLLILKFIPIGNDDIKFKLSTDEFNPDFAVDRRGFLPIVEFTEDGSAYSDEVIRQVNFNPPGFNLEPRDNFSFPAAGVVQEVFGHEYVDGLPTDEECKKTDCSVLPSKLHGNALLEFSKEFIYNPTPRDGASLYAAAILQKQEAEEPYGCLRTEFDVDIDQGSVSLSYVNEACIEEGSKCLFLENSLVGFDRECLPAGCDSNADVNEITRLLESLGGGGSKNGELTPEEQAEFDALVASTKVFKCDGNLCNTGPSSLGGGSVCRESKTNQCVEDGLVAYNVNQTDFTFVVATDVTYCDGRDPNTIKENDGSSFSGGGDEPPVGFDPNDTSGPRSCQVTGVVQALANAFTDALTDQILSPNFGNETCLDDPGKPCEFAMFDGANGTTVCLVDTCVDDRNASLTQVDNVLPGFKNATENAPRAPCANQTQLCDNIVGLDQLENLSVLSPGLLGNIVTVNTTGINGTALLDFGQLVNGTNATFTDLLQVNFTDIFNAVNGTNNNITDIISNLNATNPDLVEVLLLLSDAVNVNGTNANNGTNAFLDNPVAQEILIQTLLGLNDIENGVAPCLNPLDECIMTNVAIAGQTYCLPVGCKEEFIPTDYTVIPILAGNTNGVANFTDIPFFACNSTECNYGCRAGGNCKAEDLTPLWYNETTSDFSDGIGVCPILPIRYGYTAMINSTTRHGIPTVSAAIHNALLRTKLAAEFPDFNFSSVEMPTIVSNTQPLPITAGIRTIISGIIAFIAAIFALIAFAFVPASVASYVVQEREAHSNVKHQQMVSGAGIVPYWLSLFSFDMLMYCVPWLSALGLILAFDIRSYIDNEAFPSVAFMLFCYGLAVIPFAYMTSYLFKVHTTALLMTLFINLITGLILMIASFVMDSLDKPRVNEINAELKALYRIFPSYAVGDSLMNLATLKILSGIVGPGFELPHPLDWDIMGANVTYLLAEAIVFFSIVMLIEIRSFYPGLFASFFDKLRPQIKDAPFDLDPDVKAEEERVLSGDADKDLIRVENLRKVYTPAVSLKRFGKQKVAVRNLTFGIPRGETFGLLGINGAGKTTTFNMLVGNIFPTTGTAYIAGTNIRSNPSLVRQMVGYCPQFDRQLGLLTVREHLELFGRLKGLHGENLERNIRLLMTKLTLTPFENKLAKSLSGGNRRKLSVAMAVIGSPSIVYLDEMSTGVDPVSRRFLYDIVEKLRSGQLNGQPTSIILTTHAMDEAEALCSRIAIMVGGRIRCIGSAQRLKQRFGNGMMVEVKLANPSAEEILRLRGQHTDLPDQITEDNLTEVGKILGAPERMELIEGREDSAYQMVSNLDMTGFIEIEVFLFWFLQQEAFENFDRFLHDKFSNTSLIEHHDSQLRYTINSKKIADVFDLMERNKTELRIQEYGVSQASLESIFNLFASEQEEEKGKVRGLITQKNQKQEPEN